MIGEEKVSVAISGRSFHKMTGLDDKHAVFMTFIAAGNLVPRVFVTLVQRNGKTKTSGIQYFSSRFHWPATEHAQLYRKLINNNFVPRFPIQSRERWMCKRWVRSLRTQTWQKKKTPGKSLPRPLNHQHVRKCSNFSFLSNPIDLFGAKSESENRLSSIVKGTRLGVSERDDLPRKINLLNTQQFSQLKDLC